MKNMMMAVPKVWQEGHSYSNADDRNREGWKLVILLNFVVVELLQISTVKHCISSGYLKECPSVAVCTRYLHFFLTNFYYKIRKGIILTINSME